jgi:periplasmic protein CpxP/Spy
MKNIPVFALALAILVSCKPNTPPPAPAVPPAATATPVASATPAPSGARAERGQGGPGGRADFAQRAKARLEQMKADLALTDDQAQKIRAIMDQQMAAMQAMRSDQSMTREQRQAKFAESRQAIGAQIEALLTPEQKPKWEELKKKREAEMAQRSANRQRGGGAPPPQQ